MTSRPEPFEVRESLLLVSVHRTYTEGDDAYEAARCCWKVAVEKARQYRLVLAHKDGVVVGAFRPDEWVLATREHFPDNVADELDRWGFIGSPAEPGVLDYYIGRRVPDELRDRSPFRYCDIA